MVNKQLDNLRRTRAYMCDFIKDLSLEKLNRIPHGFNNNIIWNLGHLVAAQQSICYTKGGLPSTLSNPLLDSFKPGSRPERFFDNDKVDEVKLLMMTSVDNLKRDYEAGTLQAFTPWTNRYGNILNNIDEAIANLILHEGLHLGVVSSIKKLVQK